MTRNLSVAPLKVSRVLYRFVLPLMLLLMCGQVNAQTVRAVINPTGGTVSDNGLKLEILSDGGIRVTRKDLNETYSRTDSSTGLRAFFDFKNAIYNGGYYDAANLKSPNVCYISPISGLGTAASPWQIHIVGTILDKYYGGVGGAGQTGTVTCILTYVQGNGYFFMDYIMHLPNLSPGTNALFYLSEQSVMGATSTADHDEASKCGYGYISPDGRTLAMMRTASCAETPEATRVHIYRTAKKFESWQASIPENRFLIDDNGYFPGSVVATGIDGRGRSMSVMRDLGALVSNGFSPDPANIKTFRVMSGYGTSLTEFDGAPTTALNDSVSASGYQITPFSSAPYAPVRVAFTSGALSGNEGSAADGERVASGLTLNISGGKLGAPAYVTIQHDPTATYTHPAVVNTDFKLVEEAVLIPAGDYTTAKNIPITNLHVIGNDQLQYSRDLRLKLSNTCASTVLISGTSECTYTITDDEPRAMQLLIDSTEIFEGNKTMARIRLPSGMTIPEPITITFSTLATSTVGDSDYVVPASVVIPPNAPVSPDFEIYGRPDRTLENTERLTLRFQGAILGIPVTGQSDLNIKDSTYYNPLYNKLYADCILPTQARPVPEGYIGKLSIHLAPGVATEVPITMNSILPDNSSSAFEGDDFNLDLYSGKTYRINPGQTSTEIDFEVMADKMLEGPVPQVIKLNVAATDNVGAKRAYTYLGPDIPILDMDYDPNMKLVVTPITLKEGNTSALRLTLPNNISTSYTIPVNLSWGLSSKAKFGSDVTGFTNAPAGVTVNFTSAAATRKSITFATALRAELDNILENDEPLVLVYKPTGFTTDSVVVMILDSTGLIPGNKNMNVELVTPSVTEGNTSGIRISFVNSAIVAEDPISISLTHNPASIAATTDYSLASTTVTLPSMTTSVTIPNALTATTDGILEADETFSLGASTTSIPGLNTPAFGGTILDATGINPANKIISITPSVTTMNEGGNGYGFTFSLPAGITTEVPIVITPALLAASTASLGDFTLDSTTLTLDNLHNHSNYTGVTITDDGVTEGDETLILGGSALSAAITGIVVNQAPTVIIKDRVIATSLIITTDHNEITEGGAGANINVRLSGSATTSVPLAVTISRGGSSAAVAADYSGLPQTLSLIGNNITFSQILANVDGIIEGDETLVVVVEAPGYEKDSITLVIKDATPASDRRITFTPQPASQGTHVPEGNTYTVRAAFPTNVYPAQPVQVAVSSSVLSVAGTTDYTGVPTVITIDPATGYQDFVITAATDNLIEQSELLRIVGTVTNMAGVTTDSLDVYIDDATINDPKANIVITFDSTAVHKGSFTKVTISFADAAVTSTQDLQINIAPDPSSTADINNYNGLPTTVTLPAGSNSISYTLNIPDNFKIEGTTILQFAADATGYTIRTVAPINILDKPGAAIRVYRLADAGEPSTNGSFAVKVPAVLSQDVIVTLESEYSSNNIQPVPVTVVIPAGADSVIVPVEIIDDNIVQGDLPLTIRPSRALRQDGVQVVVNATPAILTITDDEAAAAGPKEVARQIVVEKILDATQPVAEGSFRIRFTDNTLTASRDVSVNYNVAGTAKAGTDYVGISGNVVIPAGASSVVVPIIPSGITYAGPSETVQVQLTAASSTILGVIWNMTAVPQSTLTIFNNNIDTPAVNLFAATSSITEGDEVPFVIRITKPSKKDLPITLVVRNDVFRTVSISGGTVKGDTVIVTMLPGQTEKTIQVRINDNDVNDDDGFVQVSAKAWVTGSLTPIYTLGLASEIRNTVTDNDSLKISFAADRYVAKVDFDTVDQPLPFTLRMNRRSSRLITVFYEFYTPSASELPAATQPAIGGKDYNNTVVPLLISPNQQNAEIPVLVNGVERNKMFGMRLLRASVASNQHTPAIDSLLAAGGILEICMDCDADGDGVPDYVERFITDGRWEDNNNGELRVHPALSPNNDGLGNDALFIENINKFPENDITIFNRWGGTVFTTKGYNNITNNFKGKGNVGAAKDKDVLDGSYFYIIHYTDGNGNKKRYIGYLVIKR